MPIFFQEAERECSPKCSGSLTPDTGSARMAEPEETTMEVCKHENALQDSPYIASTSELIQGKNVTFQDLIKELHKAFETDNVDVDHVQNLMRAYRSNPQDWRKYAKFDRFRYTRNLVDEGNGKFNLMILCWGEGHGSAIHDHANAHCIMKTLQGELEETRYKWPKNNNNKNEPEELEEILRTKLDFDEVTYIHDKIGLHRVENPSTINPAVSLHLYSPPFSICSMFNKKTGQRTPTKVTFWSKYGDHRNREIQDSRTPEDN